MIYSCISNSLWKEHQIRYEKLLKRLSEIFKNGEITLESVLILFYHF